MKGHIINNIPILLKEVVCQQNGYGSIKSSLNTRQDIMNRQESFGVTQHITAVTVYEH